MDVHLQVIQQNNVWIFLYPALASGNVHRRSFGLEAVINHGHFISRVYCFDCFYAHAISRARQKETEVGTQEEAHNDAE
jgi:hypothetical protein